MPFRRNEYEVEQTIFLGGQVSHKHPIYKVIARLPVDYAQAYSILKRWPQLKKIKNPWELASKIVFLLGLTESLQGYTEITRLSMILGDTRERHSLKGLKDELAKRTGQHPST